jgi:hypothetical protein
MMGSLVFISTRVICIHEFFMSLQLNNEERRPAKRTQGEQMRRVVAVGGSTSAGFSLRSM